MSGQCILCQSPIKATTIEEVYTHVPSDLCKVQLTDSLGVSVDDHFELVAGTIYQRGEEEPPSEDTLFVFEQFTRVEKALEAMFDTYGVPRLGGASGDLGWSSFATFQRCPYLWKRTYLDHRRRSKDDDLIVGEPMGLAVGSMIHTLLALHYQRLLDPAYPLTPEIAKEYLSANGCNPEVITESWRLFAPYRLYYRDDPIRVLAVEHHVVDPRSKESSRYDLVAEFTEAIMDRPAGVYCIDHKSAQRFDDATLYGWVNDGTILQQIMLWDRLHLDRRFGVLQGVIVNLIGKQKIPHFHRTFVAPNRWQVDQQTSDLKVWKAMRQVCMATGVYPRARANCIGRYGKCSQFDHCATGED